MPVLNTQLPDSNCCEAKIFNFRTSFWIKKRVSSKMPTSLCWTLLFVFLSLVLPSPSQAQGRGNEGMRRHWSVRDYPNPNFDWAACGRDNASAVCDPNHIITRRQADSLDNLINQVYRETRCTCPTCRPQGRGYIIRVALMPYFDRVFPDGENTTIGALRDAQMFSYMLSEIWRMHGVCNETVLIMYARGDNLLYTLTRANSKIVLTDSKIQTTLLNVRHYFDDINTVADGLMEMISQYKAIFMEGPQTSRSRVR